MGTEGDLTLGIKHTLQYTDIEYMLEAWIIL